MKIRERITRAIESAAIVGCWWLASERPDVFEVVIDQLDGLGKMPPQNRASAFDRASVRQSKAARSAQEHFSRDCQCDQCAAERTRRRYAGSN